jgi:hypothetical protein
MRATPKDWIRRCKTNLEGFRTEHVKMTQEEKLQFIRNQYDTLSLVRKMVKGKVVVRGVNHLTLRKSHAQSNVAV